MSERLKKDRAIENLNSLTTSLVFGVYHIVNSKILVGPHLLLFYVLAETGQKCRFFSKQYYEHALRECPKLAAATKSGEPLNDQMMTVVAFNLAYNAFYRGKRCTAIRLLHSVFNSPNLSERIYRAAALLEVQMCMELGHPALAQSLLLQLNNHRCWSNASISQLDCFELLSSRLKTKELVISEEKTTMHWFLLDVEVQFKSGEARNALNMLLKRRKSSCSRDRRLLDNAIGCIYALTFKDCNMAESYFRSAMLRKSPSVGDCSPVVPSLLVYHTALAQLGSGKPKTAFFLFLAVWPFFRSNPRIWLRITECCAQNATSSESSNKASTPVNDQLRSIAMAGWQSVKSIASNRCSSHHYTVDVVNCDAEFAAHVIHQGISIALSQKEYAYLLPYLLSLSASVNIQLGRYAETLKSASHLLNLPQINARQKLSAMFYKAEALIHLDRLVESVVCLEQAVPSQSFPYTHSRLQYNKALVQTLAGRLDKAGELLKEIVSNNLVQRPETLTCSYT
uniref:CCR4-NOT transcription complex subunit 10 n=1 Tax=Ditylenchus dipsaci TaxID=166011 RepID=A0A915DA22_9BILA